MRDHDVTNGSRAPEPRDRARTPEIRPRGSRIVRTWVILALIGSVLGLAVPTGRASAAAPVPGAVGAIDETDWIDEVLEWIRILYQTLGGDPADLDALDVPQAMTATMGYYAAHGLSIDMTFNEKRQAVSAINHLQSLLANPPASQNSLISGPFLAVLKVIKTILVPPFLP